MSITAGAAKLKPALRGRRGEQNKARCELWGGSGNLQRKEQGRKWWTGERKVPRGGDRNRFKAPNRQEVQTVKHFPFRRSAISTFCPTLRPEVKKKLKLYRRYTVLSGMCTNPHRLYLSSEAPGNLSGRGRSQRENYNACDQSGFPPRRKHKMYIKSKIYQNSHLAQLKIVSGFHYHLLIYTGSHFIHMYICIFKVIPFR